MIPAGQLRVGDKTSEIAAVADPLAGLGFASIPAAYRWVGYDCFTRPLDLLGVA